MQVASTRTFKSVVHVGCACSCMLCGITGATRCFHKLTLCTPPPLILLWPAEQEGLVDIKVSDWSNEVAPFWGAVIRTALTGQGISGLLRAGWTTIKVSSHCL